MAGQLTREIARCLGGESRQDGGIATPNRRCRAQGRSHTPNDPADISAMRAYITSFGALIDSCSTSEELAIRMKQKFPSYRLANILARSAHAAIPD